MVTCEAKDLVRANRGFHHFAAAQHACTAYIEELEQESVALEASPSGGFEVPEGEASPDGFCRHRPHTANVPQMYHTAPAAARRGRTATRPDPLIPPCIVCIHVTRDRNGISPPPGIFQRGVGAFFFLTAPLAITCYHTNKTLLAEAPFGPSGDDNGPGLEPPPRNRIGIVTAFMPCRGGLRRPRKPIFLLQADYLPR
ncbi:hypothetical protein THAOC_08839 [Thalassiosira oceanica]|uniref:Uncharacterized protein n=1 Tax=Thalassiosira oceanica TaxID=159749 RepID=K0SWQ2_THAOC|nr:hypothetical protein THAOC_08839 [Thalassiosira oceanica]|eukprot:EJK69865.1 hypothetical protein THAOC_08839 [Thalassiosira oceanica]